MVQLDSAKDLIENQLQAIEYKKTKFKHLHMNIELFEKEKIILQSNRKFMPLYKLLNTNIRGMNSAYKRIFSKQTLSIEHDKLKQIFLKYFGIHAKIAPLRCCGYLDNGSASLDCPYSILCYG